MRVLIVIIAVLLPWVAAADPALPSTIGTEANIKTWVEKTITDAPPPGCLVEMLVHWPPHYAKNDKVGEIWIVPSLVKVTAKDGTFDHEMAFVAYHVDTKATSIEVLFGIPENNVQEYLDEAKKAVSDEIATPTPPEGLISV